VLIGLAVTLVLAIAVLLIVRHAKSGGSRAAKPTDALLDQLVPGASDEGRRQAAQELLTDDNATAAKALAAAVRPSSDGENFQVAQAAIRAMAEVGPDAVPTLAAALGSDRAAVRFAAVSVLRQMGRDARGAVEPLAKALGDENRWVRWYAAEALGNIGPDAAAAIPALVPLLQHRELFTRRRAVTALGRIGPEAKTAAGAAIAKLCEEDGNADVQDAAFVALHSIDLDAMAAKASAGAADDVAALIKKLADKDEHESVAAANSLAKLGPQARPAIPSLALALGSPNKWLRVAAAEALGALGYDAHVVTPYVQKLKQDPETDVRKAAEAALARIGEKR
jgi:HEAT repeat protein